MKEQSPVVAWVVDDTGFPKKGKHSVGVARQYCGQLGKQENCRVAVSLSISTAVASLPVAFDLYLPETWSEDKKRRRKAGVPDSVEFRTKPLIAAGQIRQALEDGVPRAPVVADAAYGNDTKFRQAILDLGLDYVVGIQPTLSLWGPASNRFRRPRAKAPAAHRSVSNAVRSTNPFWRGTWLAEFPRPIGKTLPGGLARNRNCDPDLRRCGFGLPAVTLSAVNHYPSNGYWSNGRKPNNSLPNTGSPVCPRILNWPIWSLSPNGAGSLSGTTKN